MLCKGRRHTHVAQAFIQAQGTFVHMNKKKNKTLLII